MKHLFLFRHAKSAHPFLLPDFDRPLQESGVADARLVSAKLVSHLPLNILIWSSPATRAKETAAIFRQVFSNAKNDIELKESLYAFDLRQLLQEVKSASDDADNLLIFGHNEAITELCNRCGDIRIDNVPTAGLVKLTFAVNSWKLIEKGTTELTIFPRDLRT